VYEIRRVPRFDSVYEIRRVPRFDNAFELMRSGNCACHVCLVRGFGNNAESMCVCQIILVSGF